MTRRLLRTSFPSLRAMSRTGNAPLSASRETRRRGNGAERADRSSLTARNASGMRGNASRLAVKEIRGLGNGPRSVGNEARGARFAVREPGWVL